MRNKSALHIFAGASALLATYVFAQPPKIVQRAADVVCSASCTITAISFTQSDTVPAAEVQGKAAAKCADIKKVPEAILQTREIKDNGFGIRDYVVLCK